jgi:hypothetical protein
MGVRRINIPCLQLHVATRPDKHPVKLSRATKLAAAAALIGGRFLRPAGGGAGKLRNTRRHGLRSPGVADTMPKVQRVVSFKGPGELASGDATSRTWSFTKLRVDVPAGCSRGSYG